MVVKVYNNNNNNNNNNEFHDANWEIVFHDHLRNIFVNYTHTYQRDHVHAKEAYERLVQESPYHAKVPSSLAGSTTYLANSLEAVPSRPTFWCSIGVLYFQINQYRNALDACSRAIRINPYVSEVRFNPDSLYENCNNSISNAIAAYTRANKLDPTNGDITQCLQLFALSRPLRRRCVFRRTCTSFSISDYVNTVPPTSGQASCSQALSNDLSTSQQRTLVARPLPFLQSPILVLILILIFIFILECHQVLRQPARLAFSGRIS
ncbi:hypothetical protein EW145_g6227 [Phellinidium pouzarii]|uniref:Uncharacterized protein n=1 Tax=Phellinidium pouzarii TaxID=167371 RepID=A0A4S4KX90_9AGAM|nr:hypothetical protein EW145_g6227 [Phellinidium pouzarii]